MMSYRTMIISLSVLACLFVATIAPGRVAARGQRDASALVLSGAVCARATGKPIGGAQVGAQGRWVVADRAGAYQLTLPPVTRLPMRAAALGYQASDVVTIYNPDGGALAGQIGFSFCGNNGLVPAFRSADGAVRLTAFPQMQPAAHNTITITGTSTVALESDPALQDPSGAVQLLSLDRHGSEISVRAPLAAGRGQYLLEINAAAGFALIKLAIFVGIAYTPPPAPAPFVPDPRGATTKQLAAIALKMLNQIRAQAKLPSLKTDAHLSSAAQGHSADMAAHDFVGHAGSNGSLPSERVRAAGVAYSELAEDVGSGDSVQATIAGLMDSPAHRWAILGDFRLVGIGIAQSHGTLLMTLDFVR